MFMSHMITCLRPVRYDFSFHLSIAQAHLHGAAHDSHSSCRQWESWRSGGEEGVSPRLHWTGQSGKHLLYEQCDPVPLQHTGAQGLFPRSVAFLLMRISTFHMVVCLTLLCVFVVCFQTGHLSLRLTVLTHWARVDDWPLALLFYFERCGRALTMHFNPPN